MESNISMCAEMLLEKIVSQMSTRQKLGQMLMMRFRRWSKDADSTNNTDNNNFVDVTELNDEIEPIIKDYYISNILLFKENFSNEKQAKELVKEIKNLAVNIKVDEVKDLNVEIPMIIATDQEGGKVQRILFNGPYKNNSEIKDPEEAYEKGRKIGEELSDLGINCNLAPVADVSNLSSVIGARSFGDDPEYVAKCCTNFLKGLRECGILATAKHFPGHGDTSTNPHSRLPVIEKSEEELQNCELVPFKSLINENIDLIMTAHILLKKIDEYYPATLSSKILTEMLRKKWDILAL